MERRDFIKLIPGIVAGVAAGPLTSLASAGAKPELALLGRNRNWMGRRLACGYKRRRNSLSGAKKWNVC